MNKKTSKVFSIFWFIASLTWAVATVRHAMLKHDITGSVIYALAALTSLILAFAYSKDLVRSSSK